MIINPYNDEYMVYDYKVHRYVLTPKYVAEQMNIDLSLIKPMGAVAKENIPQEILRKISRTVYTQIYAVSNQNKRQEWELAKYSSARPIIMQAMADQLEYFMINGGLENYSGVDIRKGRKMQNFYDRILCENARLTLERELEETGRSIMYTGSVPQWFRYGNYEQDQY